MSETDIELKDWDFIVEQFDEYYNGYIQAEHVHDVQTSESETGEWLVEMTSYWTRARSFTEIVDYCTSREIAIEEAIFTICTYGRRNDFREFAEGLFGKDAISFAKRINKLPELLKMHDKLREVVVCSKCYDEDWSNGKFCEDGNVRAFVRPKPPVRSKKRCIGHESDSEEKEAESNEPS